MAVTARKKDPTSDLRVRRHRAKQKLNGGKAVLTVARRGAQAISTPEMCSLAARVGDGRATPGDLQMAERLIMALVDRLPPDSTLNVPL
jgi:hypothetical protein